MEAGRPVEMPLTVWVEDGIGLEEDGSCVSREKRTVGRHDLKVGPKTFPVD